MNTRFHPAIYFLLQALVASPLCAQQAVADQNTVPKIEVKVNAVLVPVVVRDAQGRAVGDLTKDDFQIFDKGKRQSISGFTLEQHGGAEQREESLEMSPGHPERESKAPGANAAKRFLVFLFDDLHLNESELLRTKSAATKMLGESLSATDMAAVLSTSGANSGLTRDTAALRLAIQKLKAEGIYRHDSHACPDIDYYQADLIQNKRDNRALEVAEANYVACANLVGATPTMIESMVRSAASQSRAIGEQDVSATLAAVRECIAKMAGLPGERTLILISPGFLTLTPSAMAQKSTILDLAASSNVTISALDARGLYTTEIGASERGASSGLDLMMGESSRYRRETMSLNEDVMAELADGTGGIYVHNGNDLEGGFKRLAQTPEYVYLLEFPLDKVKADGSYHTLKVKVDRKKVSLQARRGYFALKAGSKEAHHSAVSTTPTSATQPPAAAMPEVPIKTGPVPAPKSSPEAPTKKREKATTGDSGFWYPIDVDAPLRSYSSASCPLEKALQLAGARADEMANNLQNFTALEQIEYRLLRNTNSDIERVAGKYDYSVFFEPGNGGLAVRENRTPERGSQPLPTGAKDIGLPEIALLFLSSFQGDYEMKCEGEAEWRGRPAWVVHFEQRANRPSHTAVFSVNGVAYPARLKGRAWIVEGSTADSTDDSGEVMHLDLSLMEGIAAAKVRKLYVSIDYGPVQFRTQEVKFWLPQDVTSLGDFGDHRTITLHSFTNFLLFSVQTDQTIEKPKAP